MQEKPKEPAQRQEQEPPEEDEGLKEKEYNFNPLQAEKELNIGNFYFKKGSYKAAVLRFEEATKWNPGSGEAFLRLGEAHEKLRQPDKAKLAYAKFLEIAPDHKRAGEIQKRMGKH
ncbi:MAG: tetratricopeptide repeat protein [Acidobacteriia bacterium]|nr:tetratricopeptide repeat protein [Terriglobia bacterium]